MRDENADVRERWCTLNGVWDDRYCIFEDGGFPICMELTGGKGGEQCIILGNSDEIITFGDRRSRQRYCCIDRDCRSKLL